METQTHSQPNQPHAVVLLSGGLDSTTVLAIAQHQGYTIHALSFDYGQKNRFELERAGAIAATSGVFRHHAVKLDMSFVGGSSLITDAEVEKNRSLEAIGTGIPSTYVPARNILFLSYALSYADAHQITDIFIGVNSVDSSGYPDCRPAFIEAFEAMACVGTREGAERNGVAIHAPLMHLNKEEIIRSGLALGVDYGMTNTCYHPDPVTGAACGECDACILRLEGFAAANAADPILYSGENDRVEANSLRARQAS